MDNKAQIPPLKDGQGKPQLKIKGMAAGASLMERLKQFKKKDLAFILAGLGVLFMAPLAEHFMMSPENADGNMTGGFAQRGNGIFGNGTSPYEPGLSGMAPGGLAGSGSDIITPLNVRDPSALVMGPNATQQAPAGSVTPPPAPPAKEDDNKWRDAITAAGKAGAGAAAQKASLPVPKVPLSAGGLRGLGAVSGGSGSNFGLSAPNASGVPNRGVQSNSLTGTNGSGFKGVARGPGSGGNAGAFENLKKNAAGQAGDLNRGGDAKSALESAASREMGSGQGGGAGQGGGKDDKNPGGNQSKDSKSPGESLEFLRLKQEQEKAIDLKWKLKEKQAMMWPNLKEKMLEEIMMTPLKALTGAMASGMKSALAGENGLKMVCSQGPGAPKTFPADLPNCMGDQKAVQAAGYCLSGSSVESTRGQAWSGCSLQRGTADNTGTPDPQRGQTGVSQTNPAVSAPGGACDQLRQYLSQPGRMQGAQTATAQQLCTAARQLNARTGDLQGCCGS